MPLFATISLSIQRVAEHSFTPLGTHVLIVVAIVNLFGCPKGARRSQKHVEEKILNGKVI